MPAWASAERLRRRRFDFKLKGHGMSRVRLGRMLFLLFFIRWVGSFSVGQHGAHIDLLRRFALVCSVLLHG